VLHGLAAELGRGLSLGVEAARVEVMQEIIGLLRRLGRAAAAVHGAHGFLRHPPAEGRQQHHQQRRQEGGGAAPEPHPA